MELNLFDRNSENGTKRKVVFVGREEESGQYTQFLQSFLDEFKNDTNQKVFPFTSSVFNVYGIGGVGKTKLLRHFEDMTKAEAEKKALFCQYIDTSGYNDYIEVLHTLRNSLKKIFQKSSKSSELFFEFDMVYTLYYSNKNLEEADDSLVKTILLEIVSNLPISSVVMNGINAMKINPHVITAESGVALIAALLDSIPQLAIEIRKKCKARLEENRLRKKLEQISKNLGSAYERQQYLLKVFIEDAREIFALNPMVIMLDNLQAEGDYGKLLRDYTWLTGDRGIIASLPGLYVLGGRECLASYMRRLRERNQICRYEERNLTGISFDDIKKFYKEKCELDVTDGEVGCRMLNAAVTEKERLEITSGKSVDFKEKIDNLKKKEFLPIMMNMAADYYNQLKERKKKRGSREPVTSEELGTLDEIGQLSYFFEINLSELKRDVFYMLSCIEVWDEKWFQLVKERFNNYLLSAVHVLRSFSSLEPLDNNKLKIHDVVRESLYNSAHNQIKEDVQEWIFLYFLHMQDIYHAESITFHAAPQVIENLEELGVYAYVGMNYIMDVEYGEKERFTVEAAMKFFQQAFSRSISIYESEEQVNDQILDILNFLANRAEKIMPSSEYEMEYRRRLTLMYSYANKYSNALEESEELLKRCQERVENVPNIGRSFTNYIQVVSDRNDAFNGLGYDYGDLWRYREASANGFKSVKEQYKILKEAKEYIWFDTAEERQAYDYLLDVCEWRNYEYDIEKMEHSAAVLKRSTYYREREEGKTDGMLRRYLKFRGNIPWYYLRLPAEDRKEYTDFEPVLFGEQTYHLRKAFYGLDRFTFISWHNVSVYLKGERRYKEALDVSSEVYTAAIDELKENKWGNKNLEQSKEKLGRLKALELIEAARVDEIFEKYKNLLFYDPLILEILQYHSNYNLCLALETDDKQKRQEYINQAREEGEAVVVLRYICRNESDAALLTSWSFLASYYDVPYQIIFDEIKSRKITEEIEKTEGIDIKEYIKEHIGKEIVEGNEKALEIVRYVIGQLEEIQSAKGNGMNKMKLQEHQRMLQEMNEGTWSEHHRFREQ